MPADDGIAADALREELARLRAENDALRACFRVADPPPLAPASPRPVQALLLPDPLDPIEPGQPGPEAVTNLARITISVLRERQPDVEWRAEHDLARIRPAAQCFRLGQVLRRACGTVPGRRRSPSRSSTATMANPGCAARWCPAIPTATSSSAATRGSYGSRTTCSPKARWHTARGARHHAGWTLKAVDLVLARLALALEAFRAGKPDWREQLDAWRPKYDPRYRVERRAAGGPVTAADGSQVPGRGVGDRRSARRDVVGGSGRLELGHSSSIVLSV